MAGSATLLGSEARDRPATVASSVDLIAHGEGPEWRLRSGGAGVEGRQWRGGSGGAGASGLW